MIKPFQIEPIKLTIEEVCKTLTTGITDERYKASIEGLITCLYEEGLNLGLSEEMAIKTAVNKYSEILLNL